MRPTTSAPRAGRRAWRGAPADSWRRARPGPAPAARARRSPDRSGPTSRSCPCMNRVRPNARPADGDADQRQREPRPITMRSTSPRIGAERHANADLVQPLADEIRQHAVEANRREHQRERRKERQQPAGEARRGDRRADHFVQRPHVGDRHGAIQLAYQPRALHRPAASGSPAVLITSVMLRIAEPVADLCHCRCGT